MGKFKVGDRVRINSTSGFSRGSVGTVAVISFGRWDLGVMRDGAGSPTGFDETEVDLLVAAQPAGPVRMVPAIVAGSYGIVSIKDKYPGSVNDNVVNVCIQPTHATSAELTAAIATLTTIRDALDEVA